ncbi:MAG TPA: glycosyltransferase family 4 protein [Flavobacterium sp.]|jgi:glycosyltransferase involved in cell wall biosynthesis
MKKVLIIAYYWPPAGGPGVQRWLKFVTYLSEFGIEPTVYVPENASYPLIDNDLLKQVPKGVTVLKRPIVEPYKMASFLSGKSVAKISSGIIPPEKKQTFLEAASLWIRGNLFIPDARVLWVKPSVAFLEKYIKEHAIDTVISTGPPHSMHLIGMKLKQKTRITWIADFRDPWTTIGYHQALKLSKYAAGKHRALESAVLNQADQIIVTSQTTKREFSSLTTKPIEVITNGYDAIHSPVTLDEHFTIAHIGSLLSKRNPKILWKVLHEICEVNSAFKSDFRLKLIGAVSTDVLDSIKAEGLTDNIENLGYVSHSEAVQQQLKSQVLLLIEIDSEETKGIIPGKIFEYIAAHRPILAIGPKDADFADIISETSSGTFVTYDQSEKLKLAILTMYDSYRSGNLEFKSKNIEKYSRRNLTQQLAELILKEET